MNSSKQVKLPSTMASLFHASTNLGDFLALTMSRSSFVSPLPAIESEHASWEDIPFDIMDLISAKIGLFDRHSVGAVCKSWRSMKKECLSRVHELPWLVLPHDPTCRELSCLNLSQGTIERLKLPKPLRDAEFIGSTNGWLSFIKIEYYGITPFLKQAQLFLFNPVSGQLLKLPSIPKTPCYHHWVSENDMQIGYISSIAISSNQIKESTMVAAIFCEGLELAVCKLGDEQWTIFTGNHDLKEYVEMMESLVEDENNACYYAEILFHDDTLFVVSAVAPHEIGQSTHPDHIGIYFLEPLKISFINVLLDWEAEEDLSSLCSECLLLPNEVGDGALAGFLYLTLSVQDELLLAVQWVAGEVNETEDDLLFHGSTKRVAIFKLDVNGEGGVRFSHLKDIGDQVIFLGGNGSQVVDSKEFSGIQGNSVFFLEYLPLEMGENENFVYISRECGEYSLLTDKVVRSLPSCIESFDFHIDWFSPIYSNC